MSDDEGDSRSSNWVDIVDRGGLVRVKEGTYMLFCVMEAEVREHFRLTKATQLAEGIRKRAGVYPGK